jgi:hypothetical protein
LLWWRSFESSGAWSSKKESALAREDFPAAGVPMLVMHVKAEEPLSPDLKGLESSARETSCEGHVVPVVMPCWVGPCVARSLQCSVALAIARCLGGPWVWRDTICS